MKNFRKAIRRLETQTLAPELAGIHFDQTMAFFEKRPAYIERFLSTF